MRFFYDCEFIEDGTTIDLVSIGVVGEDGREFYAVSTEFDPSRAGAWVRANVLPKLPSPADPAWCSRAQLRADLLKFLTGAPGDVELSIDTSRLEVSTSAEQIEQMLRFTGILLEDAR